MDEIDLYIESVDNSLKPIVTKLRETIKSISKEFREEMKWNVPTYSITIEYDDEGLEVCYWIGTTGIADVFVDRDDEEILIEYII